MNPETRPLSKLYELTAPSKGRATGRTVVFCKRILVGRSDNCDLVVSDSSVSAIHAVVEVTDAGGRVYDMNSNTGTAVNGKKVVCQDIKLGDKISFGGEEFVFKEYDKAHSLPPVLDALAPEHRGQSAGPPALGRPVLPGGSAIVKAELPPTTTSSSAGGAAHGGGGKSAVAYPLTQDPKAEFSEYIFEDADHVYPIFKWSVGKSAAEVIILHKDQIFSVDYLPSQKEIHHIKGWRKAEKDVEFPYLGKGESTPFIEVSDGQVSVLDSLGYEGMVIGDENITSNNFREKKIQTPVFLGPQDILKLRNNDLQIFIRNTQAPPKIKYAPIFRRDNEARKYFVWLSLMCCILLGLFSMVTIDEEREKEKQPERIATILYKKRVFLDKKRRKPKPKKKIEKPIAVKKVKPRPKVTPKPTPIKKASSKKVAPPARKKPVKVSSRKVPPKKTASRSPPKKQPPRPAKKDYGQTDEEKKAHWSDS